MQYRADLDGLRCIAVLAVLLFHLDIQGFSGGYVGVDVFFVISGFLITSLLVADIDREVFTFRGFYERRARRILPALFVTILGTVGIAALLMSPLIFQKVAGSAAAAALSVSNFYFWTKNGYFEPVAAVTKPLLHTWSLGVEEQFYLLWPALLYWTPRKWRIAALAGLSVASLVASQVSLQVDASAAFFLLPFRVLAFGIGGLLATIPVKSRLAGLGVPVGLGLIAVALFGFDADTPIPGPMALIPCLGAALLIASGKRRPGRSFSQIPWQYGSGVSVIPSIWCTGPSWCSSNTP